jgi:hypothetical protein
VVRGALNRLDMTDETQARNKCTASCQLVDAQGSDETNKSSMAAALAPATTCWPASLTCMVDHILRSSDRVGPSKMGH